jgi:hypothetical protein
MWPEMYRARRLRAMRTLLGVFETYRLKRVRADASPPCPAEQAWQRHPNLP